MFEDDYDYDGQSFENPYEEIAKIRERLESSENNAWSLSDDYDTLGHILADSYNGQGSLVSTFNTFMEAMKSPENDKFSLADAYRILDNVAYAIAKERPDLADEAICTIKETVNSQKNDADLARLAFETIDSIKSSKPNPNVTINKFKKSSENSEYQLIDVYRAFSDIARNKPDLLDSRFGIFMKALKSSENSANSLSVASKTLDDILKAKPELDNPLVKPIKVILRPMKYLDESQKMMNFGQTIARAVNNGGLVISKDRIENEHTLSDCCKAWRICPKMPQSLAKLIGKHNIRGRVLAGAIFDKISSDKQANPQEWRQNKELQKQLYNDLENAEKMPMEKAFKQYVTDTPINRNRVVECLMREEKIKITDESFEAYYDKVEKGGTFDKMLTQTEDERQKQNRGLSLKKEQSGIEK